MHFHHATLENAPLLPGRRDFLLTRDLGVSAATGGRMRATIIQLCSAAPATGWHVHRCDAQMIFLLSGWAKMQFAGSDPVMMDAGTLGFMPGHRPHNELALSEDFAILEVSLPAEMGTEPSEAIPVTVPEDAMQRRVIAWRDVAPRDGGRDLGIGAASRGALSITYCDGASVTSSAPAAGEAAVFFYLLSGKLEYSRAGSRRRVEAGDGVLSPGGEDFHINAASADAALMRFALLG